MEQIRPCSVVIEDIYKCKPIVTPDNNMIKLEGGQQILTCGNIKREYSENWKYTESCDPLALRQPVEISFTILKKEEKVIKTEDSWSNNIDSADLQYEPIDYKCESDNNTSFTGLSDNTENKQDIEVEIKTCVVSEKPLAFQNENVDDIKKTVVKLSSQQYDDKYEKKYSCGDCGNSYFAIRLLQKHINDAHPETTNYNEIFSLQGHARPLKENKKKYKCKVCQKKFSTSDHLKEHTFVHKKEKVPEDCEGELPVVQQKHQRPVYKNMLKGTKEKLHSHWKEIIYTCNICDRRYREKQRLTSHIEATYLGLCDYKCVQCNKTYSSINVLSKHNSMVHSVNKSKYECKVCHKKFAHISYLKTHSITHTAKKYACEDCGWKCHLHTQLQKHITVNCKENLDNKCIKVKKHFCDTCGKKFAMYCNLQAHIGLVHLGIDYKCAQCNKIFSSNKSLKIHNNAVHSIKKYECQVCQKKFTARSYLRQHIFRHTIKKYECADCGWKWVTYFELKRHITLSCKANIKNRGIKVKKYSCNTCKKNYTKFSLLQAHVRLAHLGITDYKCEQCNKTYPFMWSLQRHNKLVHSVKKYECTVCHKKFSLLNLLKQHIDVHEGTKKYDCKDCGKRYFQVSHLKLHINVVHKSIKDYQCDHCNKKFSTYITLVQHINLVHKKIRNYECQFCYKTFQLPHHLQNHIICVHEKVKNYACDHCGNRFLLAHHLRNHIKCVHKGIAR